GRRAGGDAPSAVDTDRERSVRDTQARGIARVPRGRGCPRSIPGVGAADGATTDPGQPPGVQASHPGAFGRRDSRIVDLTYRAPPSGALSRPGLPRVGLHSGNVDRSAGARDREPGRPGERILRDAVYDRDGV